MKKQIARTLSLFSFCLLTANVFGGGIGEVFRPPSLDIERLMDVEARLLEFGERFGYHPQFLTDAEDDNDGLGAAMQAFAGWVEEGENLGAFGNVLQSEAARRLRAAQEALGDEALAENMEIFANWVNEAGGPPPPPPLPLIPLHVDAPPVRLNIVPAAPVNEEGEPLSIAEEAVIKQKEMAARRKAKAEKKNDDEEEDEQEEEVVAAPPRDLHMQAVFEAVRLRAAIVDQQIEEEAKRIAAEEEANQPEVVEVVLTEEELEQQRLEAEALFAEQKRQAEEREAEKDRLVLERTAFLELKKNLHERITDGGVELKKTKLPNKKRARNHSFAGTPAARVEVVDGPVHTSLVLVPDYQGQPLDLNDIVEDGNWDNLEPLFADIEETEEQVEEDKEEEKKEEESQPQQQANSWWGGSWNPLNWGGGGAPPEVEEVVVVPPTPAELIWNEIAEIVELIDIGLPQNVLDSVVGMGLGARFYLNIQNTWTGEFHSHLYYPALVRIIRARYEAAVLIVAENQIAMQSDALGEEALAEMGEALDYIDTLLKGMDAWMQRYSTHVAQHELNPGPADFLITEFPNFTESMSDLFKQLKALFLAKSFVYEGFNTLVVAQVHMLDSMTFVDTELKKANEKVALAQLSNNENPRSDDDSSLDD